VVTGPDIIVCDVTTNLAASVVPDCWIDHTDDRRTEAGIERYPNAALTTTPASTIRFNLVLNKSIVIGVIVTTILRTFSPSDTS
jgi:hypothetical protein